jgi:hypothetical protein
MIPIVIFAYKKYLTLQEVFQAVITYNTNKIYIVIDKANTIYDEEFNIKVRQVVGNLNKSVPCELILAPNHKGLIHIFDYALDIVFEKEKQAIILEDDTIPSPQFFIYCEQMLEKYKNNPQIGSIIGTNLGAMQDASNFCTVPIGMPFWGWATWADRWKSMPKDYSFWDNFSLTKNYDDLNASNLKPLLNSFDNNRKVPKSWDLKWAMYLLSKGMHCVIPGSNLISNKGYSNLATFTKIENSQFENLPLFPVTNSEINFTQNSQILNEAFIQKQLSFLSEFGKRKMDL